MSRSLVLTAALAAAAPAAAAPPDNPAVKAAVHKAGAFLQAEYEGGVKNDGNEWQTGRAALSGLALLEAGAPADYKAVQAIARHVRAAAFTQVKTYNVATCVLFLDRLGDPADRPLIQMLGARLMAGQTAAGGWGYETARLPEGEADRVRQALTAGGQAELSNWPRLPGAGADVGVHPDVVRHSQAIGADKFRGDSSDNSNTQFAVLGLWTARRHGLPVAAVLRAIELRFLTTQNQNGGWGYTENGNQTPAMTCAGLLALAVGRAADADAPKTPPTPAAAARAASARAAGIRLEQILLGRAEGVDLASVNQPMFGVYFLWSVERVGVLYGQDRVGAVDWYQLGAAWLLRNQQANGAWAGGSYGDDASTAFGLLFLVRSNLTRDANLETELRAGGTAKNPGKDPTAGVRPPGESDPEAVKVAADLLKTPAGGWTAALVKVRDAKGAANTRGLAAAARQAPADRQKDVRAALAERLTRMTADTLRGLLAGDDTELRRAAALACGMKDDRAFVPDLLPRVADDDEAVVRAARASLKSLTGQDHGPAPGATADQKKAAADAWKAWYDSKK